MPSVEGHPVMDVMAGDGAELRQAAIPEAQVKNGQIPAAIAKQVVHRPGHRAAYGRE